MAFSCRGRPMCLPFFCQFPSYTHYLVISRLLEQNHVQMFVQMYTYSTRYSAMLVLYRAHEGMRLQLTNEKETLETPNRDSAAAADVESTAGRRIALSSPPPFPATATNPLRHRHRHNRLSNSSSNKSSLTTLKFVAHLLPAPPLPLLWSSVALILCCSEVTL
jgi:hypothetical protein